VTEFDKNFDFPKLADSQKSDVVAGLFTRTGNVDFFGSTDPKFIISNSKARFDNVKKTYNSANSSINYMRTL